MCFVVNKNIEYQHFLTLVSSTCIATLWNNISRKNSSINKSNLPCWYSWKAWNFLLNWHVQLAEHSFHCPPICFKFWLFMMWWSMCLLWSPYTLLVLVHNNNNNTNNVLICLFIVYSMCLTCFIVFFLLLVENECHGELGKLRKMLFRSEHSSMNFHVPIHTYTHTHTHTHTHTLPLLLPKGFAVDKYLICTCS